MKNVNELKKATLTSFFLITVFLCSVGQNTAYKSLDTLNPIVFNGDHIIYKGKKIILNQKAFFIDGQLSEEQTAKYPFVFNSINKAVEHLSDGTDDSPMVLYIAPFVYWIDDPEDPAIRKPQEGSTPYGLIVKCEWLRFYGLSDKAENVVLACNRGQTIGSDGNFTMFKFIGQGTSSENITFGNYCNVDLVYPLKPELNRKKRATAIVQAQLIHCNGDKIVARNTRFISRLNLCPFVGGKRVLFDRCHFESTDDALCGTAVYLNSTLDFYSSKPFYRTTGTGAVFLNCDIRSFTRGKQFFTKAGGQVAVIDTRFKSETATYLGWRDETPNETRNYQYKVTLNNCPVFINYNDSATTVNMEGKPVLDAYCFSYGGKNVYNTFNLLRGDDNWDPMGVKDIIMKAEKDNGKNYSMIPVQLLVSPTRVSIETKKSEIKLNAKIFRFGNYELKGEKIQWNISPEFKSLVELKVSEDGTSCDVIPINNNNETREVIVSVSTESGLEAASVLTVSPSMLDAPKFISYPKIINKENGKLFVNYKLDMRYDDQSLVTWYRCSDESGSNPVEVAVSRLNKPFLEYELSGGDIGYYIMASVAPKHLRCHAGEPFSTVTEKPVSKNDVKSNMNVLYTDFKNFSTKNQPKVLPGFWTLTHFEPGNEKDAWFYGKGSDGCANEIGLLQGRSARMWHTPVGDNHGDMKITMTVIPSKTAGQGFSIANLYMDILIKFDTETMTGYALRFIRTTKYHDAVDCIFVKYDNGKICEISAPVSTSCFRPSCQIIIEVKKNRIIAHAESSVNLTTERPEVLTRVDMETIIDPNNFGGFGIEYTGGSSTMIKEMKVEWTQKSE